MYTPPNTPKSGHTLTHAELAQLTAAEALTQYLAAYNWADAPRFLVGQVNGQARHTHELGQLMASDVTGTSFRVTGSLLDGFRASLDNSMAGLRSGEWSCAGGESVRQWMLDQLSEARALIPDYPN